MSRSIRLPTRLAVATCRHSPPTEMGVKRTSTITGVRNVRTSLHRNDRAMCVHREGAPQPRLSDYKSTPTVRPQNVAVSLLPFWVISSLQASAR